MPGRSTTDTIFALRMLTEKFIEGQRQLNCVFIDLDKPYDRVPRTELRCSMRKLQTPEMYITVVQDMYMGCKNIVRCAVGTATCFTVEVGLHQGSASSPFLFAIIIDRLT